jgi:hypothetical protein
MHTLTENIKHQSVKSIAIAIIASTVVLYLLPVIFELIQKSGASLWYGFPFFFKILLSILVMTVIKCIGLAIVIYKKGRNTGALIGTVIFLMATAPDIINAAINNTFPPVLTALFLIIYGLSQYALPGAILGHYRKA